RRRAIAPAQITESLGSFGVVTGEQLFDPSLAERRGLRYLRNGVTTRQKPDHLEMPRCGDILASQVTIFQLINSQMLANCCHGLPPDSWRARLTALHPCGNPPSSSSQSAGNRINSLPTVPHISRSCQRPSKNRPAGRSK